MKAIVYTKYGPLDVLQLEGVEKPIPKDNEVLIRVHATSVTTTDVNARGLVFVPPGFGLLARLMLGLRKPRKRILGSQFAGGIVAVGKDVILFKNGEQVFGATGASLGAYAEYICMAEDGVLAMKPANATFEEAASVFSGTAHTLSVAGPHRPRRYSSFLLGQSRAYLRKLLVRLIWTRSWPLRPHGMKIVG